LNILFLTARFPYPVVGGDRIKPYNLLKYLAKNHNVTLVTFYQGGKALPNYEEAIKKLGIDLFTVKISALTSGIYTVPKLFSYPLEIGYYFNKKFNKIVDNVLEKKNIDLAFAFFMRTAEYLKNRSVKKILIAEDCRTLYQKRSFETSRNIVQKPVRYWEYRRLRNYEPEIVGFFDRITLVSDEDLKAMYKANPNVEYSLLSNGTDVDYFIPDEKKKREGIIFAGKLDVWANQLMIKKIIEEIMPLIWAQIPDIKLKIVGANPPKSISSLHSDNVSVVPDVPDMLPYLQTSQLFLHPHNGGSGIQNKLLEAMSSGCPVVTTPTGNQGIDAKHEFEVMIGRSNAELASHALRILRDDDFANKLAIKARQLIVKTHSWDKIFRDFDNIIDEVVE
jgi:polysaccharide biosynthesis protein PslH